MTDSDHLDPTETHEPALTRPETASADASLARSGPAAGTSDDGPFTLETALLGPLPVPDGAAHAAEIDELSRRATIYATRARGDGTRRAYRSAWHQYAAWCAALAREPLAADPDTIAMYVVRLADQGLAVSSIRVALAAIRTAHLLAGRSIDLRHARLPWSLKASPARRASVPAARPHPPSPAFCA